MSQQQTVFTEGMRVFKMGENAPNWMKCEIVFDLAEFIAWAQRHVDAQGKVRTTVCASQKGGLYAKLNEWKPANPQPQPQQQYPQSFQAPTPQSYGNAPAQQAAFDYGKDDNVPF